MTDKMTFEKAMTRLETIVAMMENDKVPLEDIVSLYEESIELNKFCRNILDNTRERINILNESRNEASEKQ